MTPDSASLEQLLKQSPTIADGGFSQAVMTRIASRQRWRRHILLSVWIASALAAGAGIVTHLSAWLGVLQPLSSNWTNSAEFVAQRVSDAALQPFWQPSGALLAAGLLAVLLAAASATVWD